MHSAYEQNHVLRELEEICIRGLQIYLSKGWVRQIRKKQLEPYTTEG